MIDAVLCYPLPSLESPSRRPALGIFCVGAMLERQGLVVEYYDERFDSEHRLDELLQQSPRCVGISTMTGHQLVGTLRILDKVRTLAPSACTVLGGVHPSLLPEQCLEDPRVDICVFGEGEATCLELVQTLKQGGDLGQVKGIWLRREGKAAFTGDRDFMNPADWPFPLTPKTKRYFELAEEGGGGEIMYQTTRGCPFHCRFCYNNIVNKKRWRFAPLDKVERELRELKRVLNPGRMLLCDDHVGPQRDRLIHIARLMKELDIQWYSSIRVDSVDVELLRILEECNCFHLLLGVESGSEYVLKEVIGKKTTVAGIKAAVRAFGQVSLRARYNFIHGLPGDSMQDLYKSMDLVDWILETDPNGIVAFDAYAPYPGTELYRDAIAGGFQEPGNMQEWSKMTLSNPLNPIAENIYYISGFKTRGKKGDVTSRNFPGLRRLLILPFELTARLRWRLRLLRGYGLEKAAIKFLLRHCTKRAKAA